MSRSHLLPAGEGFRVLASRFSGGPGQKPGTRNRKRITALLLLIGLSATAACAQGHDGAEPPRVTLVAVGVPLREALEALIDRTRIALVYDNALVVGKTAFCRAEREPLERALLCVLDGTGLDYARLSSGTYVLLLRPEEAPRYGGIEGEVFDAETGAPLPGAHVALATAADGRATGTAANGAGRFALVGLLPGPHRLLVSHVGYRRTALTLEVAPDQTSRLAVPLPPEPVLSAPIVVSGLAAEGLSARLGEGRLEADALAAASAADRSAPPDPSLAATPVTPDVTHALDAVVGIRVSEALADVHVQGGAVGEHAFLLDGAPVLVPVSLGGLVGPFSPFGLSRVVVRKAGFEAAHGSYLSGVVEAASVTGAPEGQALAVQADPLSANVRLSGRTGRPERVEASGALTIRQGLWGAFKWPPLAGHLRAWSAPDPFLIEQLGQAPAPSEPDGFPVELGFTDVHAAGRVGLGGLRSLHGSLYLARHAFGVEDVGPDGSPSDELYEDASRWSNGTGQVRYEWVQGDRAFAHVGAWASGYRLRRPTVLGATEAPDDDFSGVDLAGLRAGLDVAASPRHWITTTFELVHYDGDATLGLPGTPPGEDAGRPLGWSVAGATEDRIALGARTALTLGARLTWLPEEQALHAEPRLSLRYDGPAGAFGPWALRLAAGRYLQLLTAVDVADGGPAPLLPRVRFWLPLPAGARPPEAYHLAAEALVQPAPAWEVGAEAYAKHQPHLLVPNYGGADDAPFADADGYAYGLALRAAWRADRLHARAAYELSVARQRLPGRFGGDRVPAPWDAPHRLRAALDASPLAPLTLTLRGEAVLGRTWGFRQAYYDLLEPDPDTQAFAPFDLSEPDAHRLPAFLQLDLDVAYAATVGGGVGVQARLGLLNALGRDNVRDWLLAYDEATGTYAQRPRYTTPFLPVFAFRLTW